MITVAGATVAEHDENLKCVLAASVYCRLTLNEEKWQIHMTTLAMLG